MITRRITTVAELLRFWPLISQGLTEIHTKLKQPVDLHVVHKTMMWLVKEEDSVWFGIVHEDGNPVAFAVAQECTPMFDMERKFTVRWFYHSPLNFPATIQLMTSFESWAKNRNVHSYGVTTRRDSGQAIRCFQSKKYGFKRSHLTFEKIL